MIDQSAQIREELDQLSQLIKEVALLEMKVILKSSSDNLAKGFTQLMKEKKQLEMNDAKISSMLQKNINAHLNQDKEEAAAESADAQPVNVPVHGGKLLDDLSKNQGWIN